MKDRRHKKYAPLRFFSWSENDRCTLSQILIESAITEWYIAKHPDTSFDEIRFINSIDIAKCPLCGFDNVIKNGHTKNGMQRYLCRKCGRRFTPLTNTIVNSKKIPISEWIEFLSV